MFWGACAVASVIQSYTQASGTLKSIAVVTWQTPLCRWHFWGDIQSQWAYCSSLFAMENVTKFNFRLLLHHLLPPVKSSRLDVGFGTTGLAQSQGLLSGFKQLFWSPVQAEGARAWGRMVHDAGGGVESPCRWRQPPRPVVVLREAECIQGSQGCTVWAVSWGCWRRESQGRVVVEGEVGEMRWDEGIRESRGRRGPAHQDCPQGVDKRVRPRQGVSLPFVLHPPVLEPHLERGKERLYSIILRGVFNI